MKTHAFKLLDLPDLVQAAAKLPLIGTVASIDAYTYLDIDDDFIHQLYPLLVKFNDRIQKPDYFGKEMAGAHISIIYPEENQLIDAEDIGRKHTFKIKQAFTTKLGMKNYWALTVYSPSILALRRKYHLADKPCFKNHLIDFHITIGIL